MFYDDEIALSSCHPYKNFTMIISTSNIDWYHSEENWERMFDTVSQDSSQHKISIDEIKYDIKSVPYGIEIHYSMHHIDGLMQERRNSIANALELRLSCNNPSILSELFIMVCAELLWRNVRIQNVKFTSLLHYEIPLVVINPSLWKARAPLSYIYNACGWLAMPCEDPGHQQPWYWPSFPRVIQAPYSEDIKTFGFVGVFSDIGSTIEALLTFPYLFNFIVQASKRICVLYTGSFYFVAEMNETEQLLCLQVLEHDSGVHLTVACVIITRGNISLW